MSLLNIKIKSPNKHLGSIQPQWMPLSLCTGSTHPTTLSFGTLQILLPALINLANVFSFLFLFICDSSLSKSNLVQMKTLQTFFIKPDIPGYQRKAYHLWFPSWSLWSSSSYSFTQLTNFSSSCKLTTFPLCPSLCPQYSSLWPNLPILYPKPLPPLSTLEVA